MPRTPSNRKIKRKAKKGLYYNAKDNSFETLNEQSRRLYNKDIPKNPDVIVNEGKPDQRSMSNKEYMDEFGSGAIVDSYSSKGLLKNKRKTKVRK
jgi:hypothetical protein